MVAKVLSFTDMRGQLLGINCNIILFIDYLSRSSLSWKHHIDVGAGVVDRDYRGNVGVVLFNLSKTDYEVQHGDRIAQLIIERISTPPLVEVEVRTSFSHIV